MNADLSQDPSLLSEPNFKVIVSYYPYNNSLFVYYPYNNSLFVGNDAHTNLELHPLTHSFTVGNGSQSPLVPSATGGATWMTYDGAVSDAWTTPGGDYDADHYVDFANTTLPVSGSGAKNGTTPYYWNIASLLADPVTRNELQNYGALIKVNNESQFPPFDPNTGQGGVNDFVSFYSADNLDQTRVPTLAILLPGDTNGDGVVDLTDLNNVLNNFGVTSPNNPGDNNGDGTVDLSDLNEVLNHFGLGSSAPTALVLPEPATLSLLSLPLILLQRRRSRC